MEDRIDSAESTALRAVADAAQLVNDIVMIEGYIKEGARAIDALAAALDALDALEAEAPTPKLYVETCAFCPTAISETDESWPFCPPCLDEAIEDYAKSSPIPTLQSGGSGAVENITTALGYEYCRARLRKKPGRGKA